MKLFQMVNRGNPLVIKLFIKNIVPINYMTLSYMLNTIAICSGKALNGFLVCKLLVNILN